MRSWSYSHSKNGYNVEISEGPLWTYIVDWFITTPLIWICDRMPTKPRIWYDHKYRDWWSIHDLWHCYVCAIGTRLLSYVETNYQKHYSILLSDTDFNNLVAKDNRLKEFYNQMSSYNLDDEEEEVEP